MMSYENTEHVMNMLVNNPQLDGVITLLVAFKHYRIFKAFEKKDEAGIKNNAGVTPIEITMMSDGEQALYNKYSNLYLNALIFLHRGFSDKLLAQRIDAYKDKIKGSILYEFMSKAAEIELARRKEQREIEDIYIDIPFYLKPDFDWQKFNRTLTEDEENELFALFSFLTNKAKYGLHDDEALIYKNIINLLHRCTGLSLQEIQLRTVSQNNSAK